MRITKVVDFAAAHSIAGAGKCANKHGHNWEATIDVEHIDGPITHEAAFLVDVRDLKNAAYKYDHDDLDKYFEWASTENVAQQIADDALALCIEANPEATFYVTVNLIETKNNSAITTASNVEFGTMNGFREVGFEGAANNTDPEYKRTGEPDKDGSELVERVS